MDEKTREEVIHALRSAARALRMAEQTLLRAPSAVPAPAPQAALPAPTAEPPAVAALVAFIEQAATQCKQFEEQNPESFRRRLAGVDLLKFLLDRKVYQVAPEGDGAVRPETYNAFTLMEKCFQVMTSTRIDAPQVLAPFIAAVETKNWNDVDQDVDLVLMRYKTDGDVEFKLDEQMLTRLVEDARKLPGAVQRAETLLSQKAVRWTPVSNNEVSTTAFHQDVQANWAATINMQAVAQAIASMLALIEVAQNNDQIGWWDAASATADVPQAALPVVRGNETRILVQLAEANEVEDWAAKLPGWYDGPPDAPNPLLIRNITTDDILV